MFLVVHVIVVAELKSFTHFVCILSNDNRGVEGKLTWILHYLNIL